MFNIQILYVTELLLRLFIVHTVRVILTMIEMLSDPTLLHHEDNTQTFDIAKNYTKRNNKHSQLPYLVLLLFMVSIGKV